LDDGASYSTFIVGTTNDGSSIVSPWSEPILTLPAGVEPGKCSIVYEMAMVKRNTCIFQNL